jgi:hypothetical protein
MTLLAQFAATGGAAPAYIEDVFSTWLYTGTGATQTITNGIDLAGKGGLVWVKSRSAATNNFLFDTTRGVLNELNSNTTDAQASLASSVTAFNANGFSLGSAAGVNTNADTYASWTFEEQSKFFDVVTYTGTGANRTVAHTLGSVPGCIMVKRTDTTGDWQMYHRSNANTEYMVLNSTAAVATGATRWNSTTPTSTVFSLGTDATVNASGGTYVAYIFAHDAGGFGLTGTDNVISCGSYSSATAIDLGYEPQWLMVKSATISGQWYIINNMTGFTSSAFGPRLIANLANAEGNDSVASVTATGFNSQLVDGAGTYIYIAIRRGPMKVPTTGTSVFTPSVRASGTGAAVSTTGVGFPPDLLISSERTTGVLFTKGFHDRLRGNIILRSDTTNAEAADSTGVTAYGQDGFSFGADSGFATVNYSGSNYVYESFRRAPGFFDEVCYTGTGSVRTIAHNLAAVPELMIVKARGAATGGPNWVVYAASLGAANNVWLNLTSAVAAFGNFYWNSTAPTASVFSIGTNVSVNESGVTYVAYLFASAPGVSKVGSYTGTGTTQVINCGFTAGSRFVMIKRTDNTGDWYVWDSARGIVAGNDPYLLINSATAEVTSTDYVDTAATGFELSSTAPAALNASGGTYIFLAIA